MLQATVRAVSSVSRMPRVAQSVYVIDTRLGNGCGVLSMMTPSDFISGFDRWTAGDVHGGYSGD